MQKNRIQLLFLALAFSFSNFSFAETFMVEDFKQSTPQQFPKDWETYPFQSGKAKQVYRVVEEPGRRFLQASDDQNHSVVIFKDFDWDLKKYPYLKFRWRAQKIPEGAAENSRNTNDSACGVYVGFGRSAALKYVWSSSLKAGSYWAKDPGKFFIIPLETGTTHQGKWREVSINIPQDYQKYFQKPAQKNPQGIAVMTDGNAVQKPAACDYADFRISDQP